MSVLFLQSLCVITIKLLQKHLQRGGISFRNIVKAVHLGI